MGPIFFFYLLLADTRSLPVDQNTHVSENHIKVFILEHLPFMIIILENVEAKKKSKDLV